MRKLHIILFSLWIMISLTMCTPTQSPADSMTPTPSPTKKAFVWSTPTPTTTPMPLPTAPLNPAELTEVSMESHPRDSQIAETRYPTNDIVISDYNVLAYGADTSGESDAALAIQAALNDCQRDGGGTVWLPAGTYKVRRTIFVWPFCTLRGDWRDPDGGGEGYGTVIQAEPAPGDAPLFLIGGSAAVMGMTVYYPYQDAQNPVEYGWTFEIRGYGWSNASYHASSVINVTLLNAYKGIGINAPPFHTAVHELTRVHNVKGTALFRGMDARNCADVGTWRDITFSNAYWADAPAAYNPPDRATLDTWTRANGIAYTFADLEWDNFYKVSASDYHIGMHFVDGERIAFAGQFLYTELRNCEIAVKADADSIDGRVKTWGVSFLRSTLEGSTYALQSDTIGHIHFTDSELLGKTKSKYGGRVHYDNEGASPEFFPEYDETLFTLPASRVPNLWANLYDVTQSPYHAPRIMQNVEGVLPVDDATVAIQQALDDAGVAGGGVVYLPTGWYAVDGHLTVPSNVELRGASSVPHRSQSGLSGGTVLFATEGEGTATPETDVAFITLVGDSMSLRGLRVFYPHNRFADGMGLVYPYAVRIEGEHAAVVNVAIENGYLGVDVADSAYFHTLISVFGATTSDFITIGATQFGRVEDCHSNPNFWPRNGYGISPWSDDPKVLIDARRASVTFIRINGAKGEMLLNNFIYGAQHGVYVTAGSVEVYNIGTDNLGKGGYTVFAEDGATVDVVNSMRYNGKRNTSGVQTSFNELHL